jgi:hypothetical protein
MATIGAISKMATIAFGGHYRYTTLGQRLRSTFAQLKSSEGLDKYLQETIQAFGSSTAMVEQINHWRMYEMDTPDSLSFHFEVEFPWTSLYEEPTLKHRIEMFAKREDLCIRVGAMCLAHRLRDPGRGFLETQVIPCEVIIKI